MKGKSIKNVLAIIVIIVFIYFIAKEPGSPTKYNGIWFFRTTKIIDNQESMIERQERTIRRLWGVIGLNLFITGYFIIKPKENKIENKKINH
ncbi:hypothetical protein OSSY52_18910 [Tepiditoga spiralis]|uniref:Uncharacterized protein n=1 Tax=Tepiditoga spiralis TaxID=2108365 RepID=A0A7G1G5A4_9BACT|nr:hypothetical protein [Tepiditoga spiralis]BBE31750.1 hypothetical protein OSSY52_18910 [Tepiditoga spiralis]